MTRDREIVLQAVREFGQALEFGCEIVLTAVTNFGGCTKERPRNRPSSDTK